MKVVFLQDVPGTADAGEVKEVKNGFARNYLLPKELAVPATANHLQRIANIKEAAGERRQREAVEMRGVAGQLEGATLLIERKVGPTGRLYGSITTRHIAQDVSQRIGRELDHRTVLLPQTIHEPGSYPVTLRLHRDVTVEVTLQVAPEGFKQQQAARAAAAHAAAASATAEAVQEEPPMAEAPPDEPAGEMAPEEPSVPEGKGQE